MNPVELQRPHRNNRRGLLYGLSAYGLWGLLPLYFTALMPSGAWEIVSARVVFALVLCLVLVAALGQFGQFLAVFTHPKTLVLFMVSGVLIGCNWLLYTVATTTGHTLEASLGYFINPIVSIGLGVVVLREKLRHLQWVAVGLGATAVVVMSVFYGQVPWLALGLALTFGLYGLIKSLLSSQWSPLVGLTVETLTLLPLVVVIIAQHATTNSLTIGEYGWLHTALLVSTGAVTVVPLLLFGMSAARLPLSTVGMLQYLTPVMQFVIAVAVMHESISTGRWVGFIAVWIAVAMLILDAVILRRRHA